MNSTFSGLRLREIKHKITYKETNQRMKAAMLKYKQCSHKKPSNRIKNEIEVLRKYWGCYPLHYFRYGLYKNDKDLTLEELTNYIPEFFFYKIFLPLYDSERYSIILNDKNIMEQIFKSADIAKPLTICKLIKGSFYGFDSKKISIDELYEEILDNRYKKIFVKPADGQGGFGIRVFHLTRDNRYMCQGTELKHVLLNGLDGRDYIIQEGIFQHHEISEIYKNSVNTFRIATENLGGKVRVVCAVIRMGKEGKEVDNACQNGIILGIQCDTGICRDYGITEEGDIFFKHPDTGFVFKEYKISAWNEIKSFTMECAKKLPQFTYLGWDIALSNNGPMAVETNLGFGLDLLQLSLGGLKDAFRIYEPQKYWK